ncbi:MAG: hypothetical protein U0P45_00980 [Acidimicrobiales bacterium]
MTKLTDAAFAEAVAAAFAGMDPPLGELTIGDLWVRGSWGERELLIVMEPGEALVTKVVVPHPGGRWACGLACLYVEGGLGPAQDLRSTARSPRLLERALAAHRAALDRVALLLDGPDGLRLLEGCQAR